MSLNESAIKDIAELTSGQRGKDMWQIRKGRLTASNFGIVLQ